MLNRALGWTWRLVFQGVKHVSTQHGNEQVQALDFRAVRAGGRSATQTKDKNEHRCQHELAKKPARIECARIASE